MLLKVDAAAAGGLSWLVPGNTAAAGRCCLRRWLLELAGGGDDGGVAFCC